MNEQDDMSRFRFGGAEEITSKLPPKGNEQLARIAEQALVAFRTDCPAEFATLVRAYENSSAAVGVFGLGNVTLAVKDGEVRINPPTEDCPPLVGRGATYPEVISALARGQITALDAFNRGDMLVRTAETDELHKAYTFFAEFCGKALESRKLIDVLSTFEEVVG
jgi:hypothetical protein